MSYLIFLLCAFGLLQLFGVRASDFIPRTKKTVRQQVKQANAPKKKQHILKIYFEARQILLAEGSSDPDSVLLTLTATAILLGVALGELLGNVFLMPVLAFLFALMPFLVILMRWRAKEKELSDSLEAALSAVTTSYLRGNNTFLRAVEENVQQMPDSIRRVFRIFLLQANMIDTSVTDAMENMKLYVHNDIFVQWTSAVIRCQSNQTLKSTLPRILDKFSEQRSVAGEISIIMAEPKRTFYIMLGAGAASPFLLYFLNQEWWRVLVDTSIGKMLLALHIFAVAVALVMGLWAMNPSYRLEDET